MSKHKDLEHESRNAWEYRGFAMECEPGPPPRVVLQVTLPDNTEANVRCQWGSGMASEVQKDAIVSKNVRQSKGETYDLNVSG
jgi:hypothetical protein